MELGAMLADDGMEAKSEDEDGNVSEMDSDHDE
jgi:hypothetical protein